MLKTTIEISGDHDEYDRLPAEANAVYRIVIWNTDGSIHDVAEAKSEPGCCDAIATLRRHIKAHGGTDLKPAAFRAAYAKAAERFNRDYPATA